MDSFSISQLARFSGIKAHTIRAWERRYAALNPDRSEGNTRKYTAAQLRRLLNIVSLIREKGMLAELCALSNAELEEKVKEQIRARPKEDLDYYITQLVSAGLDFDEDRFERILQYSLMQLGVHSTYINLLYPSLNRLGLMWSTRSVSPAQEHFISHLVSRKLNAIVDALPVHEATGETWLLFLPEDEFHETGLQMSNFILRHAGKRVIYLGGNVPLSSIGPTVKKTNAGHALFFWVRKEEEELQQAYLRKLAKVKELHRILVAAPEDVNPDLSFDPRFGLLRHPKDLEEEIGVSHFAVH